MRRERWRNKVKGLKEKKRGMSRSKKNQTK